MDCKVIGDRPVYGDENENIVFVSLSPGISHIEVTGLVGPGDDGAGWCRILV